MNEIPDTELQFGIDTFGDVLDGDPIQTIKYVVEQAKVADQAGLSSINLGEHHRDDYSISAPEMVLANIAAETTNIKLGTAVVVLSSDDPVRVYERFATLQALSGNRGELTVGRGSFTESFPLFGYDMSDYEELFEEKLAMLVKIWNERPFSWEGKHTQTLQNQYLYPPLDAEKTPLFVAVGGSPQSVVRTAHHNLGLRLAIIGGQPARFAPFAELYRHAMAEFGHTPKSIGFHSPGLVGRTDEEAIEQFAPMFIDYNNRIGRERGWAPMTKDRMMTEVKHGALFVGSPETVAQKIAQAMKDLGADTFNLKVDTGSQQARLTSIELMGTEVAPRVRELLGR